MPNIQPIWHQPPTTHVRNVGPTHQSHAQIPIWQCNGKGWVYFLGGYAYMPPQWWAYKLVRPGQYASTPCYHCQLPKRAAVPVGGYYTLQAAQQAVLAPVPKGPLPWVTYPLPKGVANA